MTPDLHYLAIQIAVYAVIIGLFIKRPGTKTQNQTDYE